MLEINFCNILLVLAVIFIISFIAYNISGNQPFKDVNSSVEGFKIQNQNSKSNSKSRSSSNKLDKLRNTSKNKKLAHLNSNSKKSNNKKNNKKKASSEYFKNIVRENLENVEKQPDNSHILDADYIKNRMFDFYYAFDNKTMNNTDTNMHTFKKKWNFMKEQFWNIFEV